MVPSNVLQRTFCIEFNGQVGTCFTLDVDAKQYIVTAGHILSKVAREAMIRIQHKANWMDLPCKLVGLGDGGADIAVLAPPCVISPLHPLEPTTKGICLSQDAYFVGFPYGLHADLGALNADFPLPLVKKACVSMLAFSGPGPRYLYLDGHNNPGFSGSPVVFAATGQGLATSVAGVVSGYRYEWDKVFFHDEKTDLAVQYNTGIVIVYAIEHALALIKENPIGASLP